MHQAKNLNVKHQMHPKKIEENGLYMMAFLFRCS